MVHWAALHCSRIRSRLLLFRLTHGCCLKSDCRWWLHTSLPLCDIPTTGADIELLKRLPDAVIAFVTLGHLFMYFCLFCLSTYRPNSSAFILSCSPPNGTLLWLFSDCYSLFSSAYSLLPTSSSSLIISVCNWMPTARTSHARGHITQVKHCRISLAAKPRGREKELIRVK